MKLWRVMCLLLLASVLVFNQTSLAAESEQPFNWTGPYVGLHLGYGWGDADTNVTALTGSGRLLVAPLHLSPDPSGVIGGGQVGYNYQMGCFVVGLEADFSGSGIDGSQTISPVIQANGIPFPNTFIRAQESINWFGTLRPRLGYTLFPSLLLYGTGGLAYGNASYSAIGGSTVSPIVSFPESFSKTKVGWTVGGGAEYAIAKNWTIKAEYLFMDLGSESFTANPSIASFAPIRVQCDWETMAHILNIGVNYKF